MRERRQISITEFQIMYVATPPGVDGAGLPTRETWPVCSKLFPKKAAWTGGGDLAHSQVVEVSIRTCPVGRAQPGVRG